MKGEARIGDGVRGGLRVAGLGTAVALSTGGRALAAQCAMCGTALGGPEDPTRTALLWSVLLLLAVPFTLFGSVAAWLVVAHRRARGPGAGNLLPFRREESASIPPEAKEESRWIER